jgi:hypothetical protein
MPVSGMLGDNWEQNRATHHIMGSWWRKKTRPIDFGLEEVAGWPGGDHGWRLRCPILARIVRVLFEGWMAAENSLSPISGSLNICKSLNSCTMHHGIGRIIPITANNNLRIQSCSKTKLDLSKQPDTRSTLARVRLTPCIGLASLPNSQTVQTVDLVRYRVLLCRVHWLFVTTNTDGVQC